MILTPHETRAVATGRKTMTRVPVRTIEGIRESCPYPIGSSHAVQPGAGSPGEAQIAVTDVRRELAGLITPADAKLEGNKTVDWWKQAWVRKHDREWLRREHVDLADIYGDHVVPFILCKRFDEHWATTDVWVVRFWLDDARPRYLARVTRTSGDYVTSPSRSIDRDSLLGPVPVADPEYVAAKTREGHAEWVAQRESFRRDLEAERASREAQRRPMRRAA